MSIYVYATRRKNPFDSGEDIPLDGWMKLAEADASLRPVTAEDYAGVGLAMAPTPIVEFIWERHPDGLPTWFSYSDGSVHVRNPDERMIVKLQAIAGKLHAHVVSETGEIFNEDGSHKGFIDGEPW